MQKVINKTKKEEEEVNEVEIHVKFKSMTKDCFYFLDNNDTE